VRFPVIVDIHTQTHAHRHMKINTLSKLDKIHSLVHAYLTHPPPGWQPGCEQVRNFRDFSVFSPQKLFGGLASIWAWRWKLHVLHYRLVKVS